MRIVTLLGLSALAVSVGVAIACVGDTPPAPAEVSCKNYCDKIQGQCVAMDTDSTGATVNNLVYKDDQMTCNFMCTHFDVGAAGDINKDTLGCRLTELSNIDDPHTAAERHDICLKASAFSTSCGGTLCEHFCKLDPLVCGSLFPYADNADCLAKCATYAEHDGFTPLAQFVSSTGNNLRCRAYHMENAVVSPTANATHCPHTGVISAVCFDAPDGGGEGGMDSGTPDSGAPDSAGD